MVDYEPSIGLEIHAQLLTESKMFCSCSAAYGGDPNTKVCPVCLGLPGALPVVNGKAVEYAIKMGLTAHCKIASRSVFARKNYFYPDCPKNYQISQYDRPLCEGGFITLGGESRKVRITRIHLEEDAGKLIHDETGLWTFVDMNRCGVPLIEIVTEPDIRSPEEASLLAEKLRTILRYLEICDGNMEEGSLRCDVNISLRAKGGKIPGTKTEIKNLNSFRAMERALEFEIERQADLLRSGQAVQMVTLLWDSVVGRARVMRSKEEVQDYRYFPEPDLMLLETREELVEGLRQSLPEMPEAKAKRLAAQYGIPEYDSQVLTASKDTADYFEDVAARLGDPMATSKWIMGEVLRELNERAIEIRELNISPENLAGLIKFQRSGRINMSTAKDVFREMARTGKSSAKIIVDRGLEQISDDRVLGDVVQKVLEGYPDEVAQFQAGKKKLLAFFVGQVMKETKGKADPHKSEKILINALKNKMRGEGGGKTGAN